MFPSESNLESFFTFEEKGVPVPEELPFHILLLGNWCGDNKKINISDRIPLSVDRDNFEETIEKLQVFLALDLNDDGNILKIDFHEFDDFHPDNLFQRISLFQELRDLRKRLNNANSFDEAANQVRKLFNLDEVIHTDSGNDANTENHTEQSENLLDNILSGIRLKSSDYNRQTTENTELGRFVAKIVSPHLIKFDENEQAKLIEVVDNATSNLMRQILHHSKFQELEASWRGLYFLVKRLETDVNLKIFILDFSKEELSDDLRQVSNLADSNVYKLVISNTLETSGGIPFSVIGGNYSFEINVDDIATLMRIAKISQISHSPFVSFMKPQLFGIDNFQEVTNLTALKCSTETDEFKLWNLLRSVEESDYLCFSPMRILARLPYGKENDGIETFYFEEFTGNSEHSKLLWINPCFGISLILGQSFRLNGWDFINNLQPSIENLPQYLFKKNEVTSMKPCSEIFLTDSFCETLLEKGFTPLISYLNSDKVSLFRLQSISVPSRKLNGRWFD